MLERLKWLRAREAEEEGKVQPWMAVDRKQPWFDARREVARGEALVAQAFAEAVSAGERALASDPDEPEVRAWMASLWWRYREAAEQRGDESQVTFASSRVRAYDAGHYARRLAAMGRLVLHTDPPGAQVFASRYDRTGIVWALTDRIDLGKSPVVVDLPTGSWLCEVQAPGRPLVRYPVVIDAAATWDNSAAPLRLPTQGEWPDGFCYVPGGPAIVGGDIVPSHASPRRRVDVASIFIARFPVTAAEYCEFLNAISQSSADEAVARAPRSSRSSGTSGEPYWIPPRPGEPWVVPEVDTDGSRWTSDWPVMGVSWADAQAFAAWRAERDARPVRLPFHLEWEKGARGVDGRLRPWGMEMDASLCKCSQTRGEGLQPEPVGTFPTDVSPYGIQDTCGGVREWLADEHFDGDPTRRPASGGSWASSASQCRLTNRFGFETLLTRSFLGFRLACSLTRAR